MTVRINKKALNLREELTKAQGVVRYEQRQFWMDGLVENGTFDSGTDGWVGNSATLSVSNGQLITTATSGYSGAYQVIPTKVGKKYIFSANSVSNSRTVYLEARDISGLTLIAGSEGNAVSSPASLSLEFVAKSSFTRLIMLGRYGTSGDVGVWDNVTAFEVDENNNVIHSVPLGFKPVHVYEDGLLQREGANHDYTVVDTGFGYQVKPTVAPSATTETCIIAEREL